MLSIFGNTVAFDGSDEGDPGSGLGVATGIDVLFDPPPQPETARRMNDERKRAAILEANLKLQERVLRILLKNNSGSTKINP
jgi:hypothetical protein